MESMSTLKKARRFVLTRTVSRRRLRDGGRRLHIIVPAVAPTVADTRSHFQKRSLANVDEERWR
jgi:hypothetical protein